jgi:hypothetical protein
MQKLVSIYLDVSGYIAGRPGIRFSNSDLHGHIEEHLEEYLSEGWTIRNLSGMRGTESGGWVLVVLERD